MKSKAAVLLFGGFNPFTNAHLLIGELALKERPDADIIYVPARLKYLEEWKGMDRSDTLPEKERLELIKGSIKDIEGLSVTDIELNGTVDGKTINTVNYFKNELGYEEVTICMGTDKVAEFETWYRGRELIARNKFLIITRGGVSLSEVMTDYTRLYADHFTPLFNDRLEGLSATKVREAIREGNRAFVKESVPDYVYRHFFGEE